MRLKKLKLANIQKDNWPSFQSHIYYVCVCVLKKITSVYQLDLNEGDNNEDAKEWVKVRGR